MKMTKLGYFSEFLLFPPLVLVATLLAFRSSIPPQPVNWAIVYGFGLVGWTLIEYWLHRVLFHHAPILARLHERSASGPCFAVPHSPWSRPFAPRAPPQPRPLCSLASLLLWAGPTSPSRSSSATASGLPDAIPATTGGDSDGDLPVPGRKASAHARVYDDAGLARVLR